MDPYIGGMWLLQALLGGSVGAYLAGSRRISRRVGFLAGVLGGAGGWLLLRYRGSRVSSSEALPPRLQDLVRTLYLLSSSIAAVLSGAWMLSLLWLSFHVEAKSLRVFLDFWQAPGPWLWSVWLLGVAGVLLLWLLSLWVLVRDRSLPARSSWMAALVLFNFVAALWWLSEPVVLQVRVAAAAAA